MTVTAYTLCFPIWLPENGAPSILMVEKLRGPAINIGKWNGIGGKIEREEAPLEACVREMKEETGLVSTPTFFGSFHGEGFKIALFKSYHSRSEFSGIHLQNDVGETLAPWDEGEVASSVDQFAQNVPVMVNFALHGVGEMHIALTENNIY